MVRSDRSEAARLLAAASAAAIEQWAANAPARRRAASGTTSARGVEGGALHCCRFELRAKAAIGSYELQRQNRHLARFRLRHHAEANAQQRPQHQQHARRLRRRARRRRLEPALDIEAIRVRPVGRADDLKILQLIRQRTSCRTGTSNMAMLPGVFR